jgi:phage repressor protein C with HTH and peptisase S24 domain
MNGTRTIDLLLTAARSKGLRDVDVARALGVNQQRLQNWKKRGLPTAMNMAAAEFIGCSIDELVGRSTLASNQVRKKIPVVGTAQLGDGGFWLELGHPVGAGDGFIDVPSDDTNAYAVKVVGDSMHPRIKSGEFVICEPNRSFHAGDEVLVVTKDGRSTVKEYLFTRDNRVTLNAVNNDHGRLTLEMDEIEKIHFVAAIVKSARWRAE